MNSKNELQKMLVISPKVFENLKHLLLSNEKTESIDKTLKKIISDPKMNDYDKWNLFRHNQFHHANLKRQNNYSKKSNLPRENAKSNKNVDASTNTKRKFFKSAGTDVNDLIYSKNIPTQTEILPSDEKIFESSLYESFHGPGFFEDANAEAETEYNVNDQTLDYSDIMREEALKGRPRNVRIVSKLQSRDPKRFSLYELSDGTDVEVKIPGKFEGIDLTSPPQVKKTHKKQSTPKKKGRRNKTPEWNRDRDPDWTPFS